MYSMLYWLEFLCLLGFELPLVCLLGFLCLSGFELPLVYYLVLEFVC